MNSSLPARMKAARVNRFGAPGVISLEEIAIPAPGENQVLVEVKAAGVGPWDGWIRSGKSALPQPLPLTLGSDLSGIVAAIGSGVSGFQAGEQVFGVTNPRFTDAYADYAIASAAMIARKPAALDDVEAASVPVIAVTAWQALFEQAHLKAGESVLIHGAAGNVGAFAVQMAHQAGLHVLATAGADDLETVRGLGADVVVDFRNERFEDVTGDLDAVIDLVGGETQTRSFAVLKRGGSLVSAVSQPDQALAARHGVTAGFFLVEVTTQRLDEIAGLITAGKLKTNVGLVLPLAEARIAHEMLEGTRPRPHGKIVLRVSA
ncbi:quinone oxidoreductase [Labrys miyagiensis]|uniref:Quinone oxidoreductase n=1 Tax=Labrys miyagiensis TaxID=346912 RepID=A0ABQ6CML2_9HYPH|nr:NADP-dependent oxidoreductase [Labrys miyagiensis]GLS19497.1 quinone oxidoreductase [Labrys miyagiensis]